MLRRRQWLVALVASLSFGACVLNPGPELPGGNGAPNLDADEDSNGRGGSRSGDGAAAGTTASGGTVPVDMPPAPPGTGGTPGSGVDGGPTTDAGPRPEGEGEGGEGGALDVSDVDPLGDSGLTSGATRVR